MCKSVGKDSVYQAGSRGWLWIKFKRDYRSEMTDTVDLVVVGAIHGRGKRVGAYGALLLATYNPDEDTFETVTKCGTGFTDKDLATLHEMLQKHVVPRKNSRVKSTLEADVWFEPAVVLGDFGCRSHIEPHSHGSYGFHPQRQRLSHPFPTLHRQIPNRQKPTRRHHIQRNR